MPFFSVIIPVYNVAPYLRECLDSVLAQTFTNWEAICVDDGSTDGSDAILDEYAAANTRFKVVHQKNAGVSAARNAALDMAQGEWIGFLDADDIWDRDWLERVTKGMEVGVDWIRTGWTEWDESNNSRVSYFSSVKGSHNGNNIFTNDIVPAGWYLISRCSTPFVNFFKRHVLNGIQFRRGVRFREDALFCYEVALRSRGLRIIAETGYSRRKRLGSATFSKRRRDDTINLLTSYVKLWKDKVPFIENGSARTAVVDASTFWVLKDFRQWLCLCDDKTYADTRNVARLLRQLRKLGAISRRIPGTLFDNWRWRIFLATGWSRMLRVTRQNPLGRQTRKECQ